jgi:hypothetical protein
MSPGVKPVPIQAPTADASHHPRTCNHNTDRHTMIDPCEGLSVLEAHPGAPRRCRSDCVRMARPAARAASSASWVPRAYVVAPNGPPPLSSSVLCSVSCEYPSGTNINAERWPQSRRKPNGRGLARALVVCAYARDGVQRAPVTRRATNVRPPAGTRWPTSPTLLHGALVVRSPDGDKGAHFGHKGYVLSRAATAYRCVYSQ